MFCLLIKDIVFSIVRKLKKFVNLKNRIFFINSDILHNLKQILEKQEALLTGHHKIAIQLCSIIKFSNSISNHCDK